MKRLFNFNIFRRVDEYKCQLLYVVYVYQMASMLLKIDEVDELDDLLVGYLVHSYVPVVYFVRLMQSNKISKEEMVRALEIACEKSGQATDLAHTLIDDMNRSLTHDNVINLSDQSDNEIYLMYKEHGIIPFLVFEFVKYDTDLEYNIYEGILNIIMKIQPFEKK